MRSSCRCWPCRRERGTLHDLAPRLARARDSLLADLRAARERRAAAQTDVLELERLVAHRELQLLRGGATHRRFKNDRAKRRYVAERQAKLTDARDRLAEAQGRLAAAQGREGELFGYGASFVRGRAA